jgi:hypothetical protein
MSMAEVCNTLDTMHDKQAILIRRMTLEEMAMAKMSSP